MAKDARFELRCTADDLKLLRMAAEIEGVSLAQYVLNASGKSVERTLKSVMTGEPYHRFPSRRPAIMEFLTILGKPAKFAK